jgi:serine/threonine protein kinase
MQIPPGPNDGAPSVVNDRFAIEREAGRGGMGVVYKAIDLRSGHTVALKILRRGAHGSRERERFEREAQVLATLRHQAIVSYVAHGQTPEGSHFLAMEWVDGYPLTERLRHGPLNVGEALGLLRLVASGLSEAHRLGIMHRDLKPSNILLRNGKLSGATILDFGIARGGILPVVTQTGVIVGTPEYMSPEQARGRRDLTPASDVFSLGCLMFECLTGRPPFVAEQIAGVLAKILFDQAPLLSSFLPDAPHALEQLIASMLAKEPADRIADAGSLVLRLAALRPMQDAASIASTDEVRRQDSNLTDAEQALVGVLIASQPLIVTDQETLEIDGNETDSAQWKSVQNAMMQLGGRPEWLADGSLVVTIVGRPGGFATDLALQSARCALLLRDLQPNATVAMAMGRGQLAQPLPIGEGIDRALRLLRIANPAGTHSRLGTPRQEDGVRIDSVSAGLLLGRADLIQRSDGSALLISLPREADPTRPLLGKATPCIGREQDLLGLERALQASLDESTACAITLTGPPGVGKSRLRHELLRRLRSSDLALRVLSANCDAQRFGASYGLLRQLLRGFFGFAENDSVEERRLKLIRHPQNPWPRRDNDSSLPFLGELCGISFPDDDNPVLRAARREPQQMSEQIVRAFVEFIGSLTTQQPLLIVLDDLQWCDTLSIKLLEQALRTLYDRPLVLLAFARPEVEERFPNLWTGLGQRIRLAGLSKKASERLVYHALGANTPVETVARIVNLADGNALFLEELIRSAAAPSGAPQPETVLAMLQSRIGRLPAFQRLLLRAASVLGQSFSRGGIRALLGATAESLDLDSQLVELIDAEMVLRLPGSRYSSESEYAFRHGLLRDAAYTLLTDADRSLGHRLAARYLASVAERAQSRNTLRDLRPEPLAIADHFRRGGNPEAAVRYYVQAAEEAFAHHDLSETQRITELAQSSGASGEHLGMLLSLQSWVAHWNGQGHRVLEVGSDSIALLERGSGWWCKTTSLLASSAVSMGRRADAKVLAQILLDTSPTQAVLDPYLEALGQVLTTFSSRLEREWARRLLNRIHMLLAQLPRRDGIGVGIALLAESLYLHDLSPQPWREVTLLQEALAIFQSAQERRLQLWAQQCLGEALCNCGARDQGLTLLRQGVQRALALGQPLLLTNSQCNLADALVQSREPHLAQEAETLASELLNLEKFAAAASAHTRGHALLVLAGVRLQGGDWAQAEELAHQAYQQFEGLPLRQIASHTLMVRALLGANRYAEASVQGDALQHVLDSWGGAGQPEVAARVAIAEAFEADGDVQGARRSLDIALHLIQRAAESFPGEAERQRFLQEVPENAMAAEFSLIVQQQASAPQAS